MWDDQLGEWFDVTIQWKLCKGDKIEFLEDQWVGVIQLANTFPRLYMIP